MTDDAETTIARIMSVVLERPVTQGDDIHRADVATWDSLRHIEMMLAVESAFGLTLTEEQIAGVDSLSAISRLVRGDHVP